MVKLNLLRLTRVVCDNHPDRATLISRFDLAKIVDRLAKQDEAILVRELAKEIYPSLLFDTEQSAYRPLSTRSLDIPHESAAVVSDKRALEPVKRSASDNAAAVGVSALAERAYQRSERVERHDRQEKLESDVRDSEKAGNRVGESEVKKAREGKYLVDVVRVPRGGEEDKSRHKRKISRSHLK